MAHDTAVLGADAALRATTGEGFDDITLYSKLAEGSSQRLAQGDSAGDIIKDSAFNLGANALTVGTYGTLKEQFSTAADFLSGNASIDQVEERLIQAAGGAVLNAGLGAAGSRVTGQGWLGKPLSAPKPSAVIESVTQLPARARASAGRAAASARAIAQATNRVLQSEVRIQHQPGVISAFGAGSFKVKLIRPGGGGSGSGIRPGSRYDIGEYTALREIAEPGLHAHHVGQKALMKRFIPDYDPQTGPSILVPKVGHTLRGPKGIVARRTGDFSGPRQVLARDIREMRRVYPDVPNAQLMKLIEMNKQKYPSVRVK